MLELPQPRQAQRMHAVAAVMSAFLLDACSASPSRNILGSYFPTWMLCALLGIAGTAAIRFILIKTGVDAVLPMPALVYLCFWVAVTLTAWLVWLA